MLRAMRNLIFGALGGLLFAGATVAIPAGLFWAATAGADIVCVPTYPRACRKPRSGTTK